MNIRLSILSALILFGSACVQHDLDPQATDCSKSDLEIYLTGTLDASTCSASDGSITVEVTGGEPPYLFELNSTQSPDRVFAGLRSGGYSVTVTDTRGCQKQLSNIIISASGFSFSAEITEDTDCTNGNGTVTLTVNEGTPPFEYRFMEEAFSENSTFGSLEAGAYKIGIRDSEGCTAELEVTIPKGTTGTSWENSIRPMISTYCALSGCHNGVSRPDLRTYEKAKQYAKQIKTLTEDRSMPFEGSLTQDQIDLIGCWVDEGALQN